MGTRALIFISSVSSYDIRSLCPRGLEEVMMDDSGRGALKLNFLLAALLQLE